MFYKVKVSCPSTIEKGYDPIFERELKTLTITCKNCPFFSRHRKSKLTNPHCLANIIKLLMKNQDLTSVEIKSTNDILRLSPSQINILVDYANQLSRNSRSKRPTFQGGRGCAKEEGCKNKQRFFLDLILGDKTHDGLLISDPIMAFTKIDEELKIYEKMPTESTECKKCDLYLIRFVSNLHALLSETKIIKGYLALERKDRPFSEIYELIFGDSNLIPAHRSAKLASVGAEEIYDSYQKGPYQIRIVRNLKTKKCAYRISPITDDPALKKIVTEVIRRVDTNPKEFFDSDSPLKFNFLLRREKRYIMHLIRQNYEHLTDNVASDLSDLVVYHLTNLNPLMAFLLDDEIEEVFLDAPNSFIYLDHRKFGRCSTKISLTPMEIESFKTRIRMESGQRLDEIQPFLKTEIITDAFHIRVSIQIHPLAVEGFSLNIRKLHKKILTLVDLIQNKTLPMDAASYLLFNFIHGRCILVIGEPYSGKTTLINSLDMIGEEDWRKVYIEDVIESIDQSPYGVHQIRFQVEPTLENPEDYATKSFQVKESLHRTPDAIFIGELIHPKSVESFFFLLKVGLRRCLATAHGESPELIVERFIYDDEIPLPLIGNLDIIVQMSRFKQAGHIIRRVTRITEVQKETLFAFDQRPDPLRGTSNLLFKDIFLRNPESDQLEKRFESFTELYEESTAINKIKLLRGELMNKDRFIKEISRINRRLRELMQESKSDLGQFIKSFHALWQEMEA